MDPHDAPVPPSAYEADRAARARGRVEMFNATRPGGLDGWTVAQEQYDLVRDLILAALRGPTVDERGVALADLVHSAQERLGGHPAFPAGRLRNSVTYIKVDLQARREIERVPGGGAQRIRARTVELKPRDAAS